MTPQSKRPRVGFWTDFRRSFLRGLATTLPTLLTIAIILYVFNFVQDKIGDPINGVLIRVIYPWTDMSEEALTEQWYKHWYYRGLGFVVAIVGVYLIGRLVASFVGRSLWKVVEHGMTRTPIIKQIYPNVKQVTDFLLSESRFEFSRVVAVEYPRKGVWSLGLVTGSGLETLRKTLGPNWVTVFVPSSPTPVTGYTIVVRRDEMIDLPLTIDEALRFTVSGGVLTPPVHELIRRRTPAKQETLPPPSPPTQDAAAPADTPRPAEPQEKDS